MGGPVLNPRMGGWRGQGPIRGVRVGHRAAGVCLPLFQAPGSEASPVSGLAGGPCSPEQTPPLLYLSAPSLTQPRPAHPCPASASHLGKLRRRQQHTESAHSRATPFYASVHEPRKAPSRGSPDPAGVHPSPTLPPPPPRFSVPQEAEPLWRRHLPSLSGFLWV